MKQQGILPKASGDPRRPLMEYPRLSTAIDETMAREDCVQSAGHRMVCGSDIVDRSLSVFLHWALSFLCRNKRQDGLNLASHSLASPTSDPQGGQHIP